MIGVAALRWHGVVPLVLPRRAVVVGRAFGILVVPHPVGMEAEGELGVVPEGDLDRVPDLGVDGRSEQAEVLPARIDRREGGERLVGVGAVVRLAVDMADPVRAVRDEGIRRLIERLAGDLVEPGRRVVPVDLVGGDEVLPGASGTAGRAGGGRRSLGGASSGAQPARLHGPKQREPPRAEEAERLPPVHARRQPTAVRSCPLVTRVNVQSRDHGSSPPRVRALGRRVRPPGEVDKPRDEQLRHAHRAGIAIGGAGGNAYPVCIPRPLYYAAQEGMASICRKSCTADASDRHPGSGCPECRSRRTSVQRAVRRPAGSAAARRTRSGSSAARLDR